MGSDVNDYGIYGFFDGDDHNSDDDMNGFVDDYLYDFSVDDNGSDQDDDSFVDGDDNDNDNDDYYYDDYNIYES